MSRSLFHNIVIGLLIGCIALTSCWGGSSSSTSDTSTVSTTDDSSDFTSEITISGSIELPAAVSSSVSAFLSAKKNNANTLYTLVDEPKEGCTVTAYTPEGVQIGDPNNATTTAADGTFSLPTNREQLLSSTADPSTSDFTSDVVFKITCPGYDGEIESYMQASVASDTTELAASTVTMESDIAMGYVKSKVYTVDVNWGQGDFTGSILEGKTLQTSFVTAIKMVLNGNAASTSGMDRPVGLMTSAYKGFLAGGGKSSDVGFASKDEMLQSLLNGEFASGTAFDSFITVSSSTTGVAKSNFDNFSTIQSNFEKVGGTLMSQLDAEADMTEDQINELTKIVLAAGNATIFDTVLGTSGMFDHFVNMAKQTSNLTDDASADPYAVFGMMTQLASTPTKTYTEDEYLDFINVAADEQFTSCTSVSCKDALAKNMFTTIDQQGFGIVGSDAGITAILSDMRTTYTAGGTISTSKYTTSFVTNATTGGTQTPTSAPTPTPQQSSPFAGTYRSATACRGISPNTDLGFNSSNGTTYSYCPGCTFISTFAISAGECTGFTATQTSNSQSQTCSCTRTTGTGSAGTAFNISCGAVGPLPACSATITKQ